MTVYPNGIDNSTTLPPATGDEATSINAGLGAIIAVETELGIDVSGVYADVRTRLDILESRINNPFSPSPDVLNPFFIGNTGVTIQAGFGNPNIVLATSPSFGSLFLREDGYNIQGLYAFRPDGYWHQIDTDPWTAAGDLSGTAYSQTVIGLQNNPVQSGVLGLSQDGYVLTWTNIDGKWEPKPISSGSVTLMGDVTGPATSNTVSKIRGVVISGTPSAGYVLEATSSSAASWQAPSGDITLAGDVTGAANANTVIKVDGVSYPAAPSTNTVPVVTSSNTVTYQQLADAQVSSSAAIAVSKLAAGTAAQVLLNNSTPSPTWTTLSADVTITNTGVTTVNAIQGVVISGTPSAGYVLEATSSSAAAWLAPSGDVTLGGDVTGPAPTNTVGKIQGNTVTSGALVEGDLLIATSTSNWASTAVTGDVAFSAVTPGLTTVLKVDGVSYPASPSTNTVPVVTSSNTVTYQQIADAQVSATAVIAGTKIAPNFGSQNISTSGTLGAGAATLTSITDSGLGLGIVHSSSGGLFSSSAVNLSGADVTGVLPIGNQANQTLLGDVTGNTGASVVSKISGSSPIAITPSTLQWTAGTAAPVINQAQSTTGAGANLNITAQAARSGHNEAGGNIIVQAGLQDGSGSAGTARLSNGDGTLYMDMQGNGSPVLFGSKSGSAFDVAVDLVQFADHTFTTVLNFRNTTPGMFVDAPKNNYTIGQDQSQSGAGRTLNVKAQQAASGSNTNGGTLVIAGGLSDGTGKGGVVQLSSGQSVRQITITAASYTADTNSTTSDYQIFCDVTSGGTTITLPAQTAGRVIVVKDISGLAGTSTNHITVSPASGTIDGSSPFVINTNYGSATFTSDSTNWWIS